MISPCSYQLDANPIRSAHLIGVCGTGMKALSEMLIGMGCRVTGSDQQRPGPRQLAMAKKGLRIHFGHGDQHLPDDVDVLVHSPAIDPNNAELQLARQRQIPILTYSQMLGRLMASRTGVSIAGTHGKSTTTALVASALQTSGREPSAIIGAELCQSEVSGWTGAGDLFVVESCEYQRNFLELNPTHAVVLGVEADHFDCFTSIEQTVSAFQEFTAGIPSDGSLLLRNDCPHTQALATATHCDVTTFSLQTGADWWASDIRQTERATRFRVFHGGTYFSEVLLPLTGQHNVSNALAAIGLLHRLGLSSSEIQEGLLEFPGIGRRYERKGSWRGITLIDDYAHHPTAIKTTLETARREFGNRRIWCAFQPHQVSRTQNLLNDFQTAFGAADKVLISPVFAARENVDPQTRIDVSTQLADKLNQHNCSARSVDSLDQMIATLDDEAQPGDVLVTMGAGDINRVHYEFTRRLQRHPSTR